MNKELKMVKELYERCRCGESSLPPKQGIFNWKCPKCAKKLTRKAFKAPLYVEAGGAEFACRVACDRGVAPGLYNITMAHFTCTCGYEHISEKLDQVEM